MLIQFYFRLDLRFMAIVSTSVMGTLYGSALFLLDEMRGLKFELLQTFDLNVISGKAVPHEEYFVREGNFLFVKENPFGQIEHH